jgi:hypothetical protein
MSDRTDSALSPPWTPPPAVKDKLAEKTPAQRRRLTRAVTECLLALRAVRSAQRAQRPDGHDWEKAKVLLDAAITGLADEAGQAGVPPDLQAVLALHANHRTAAFPGPEGEKAWKGLGRRTARLARKGLRLLRWEAVASSQQPGPDFRSYRWGAETFHFTATQAACVRVLWQARQDGTPDVGQQAILDRAGSVLAEAARPKLHSHFRNHPAWGTLIVPGMTQGTYRLADPRPA